MEKKSQTEPEYEEVEAECTICGKKIKTVIRKGASTESFVCQKCGAWDTEGAEE